MDKDIEGQIRIIDGYLKQMEEYGTHEDRHDWQIPYFEMLKHWTVLKDKLKELDKERTKGHGHD